MRSSLVILFFACLCLAAGCLSSGPAAEDVYERAEVAFQAGNYRTAEDLYGVARNLSRESGDADLALAAKRGVMRARYSHIEFPCDRSAAEAAMREKIPRDHRGGDRRVARYPGPDPRLRQRDPLLRLTAANYRYAHPARLREMAAGELDIDRMGRYAWADDRDEGHYTDPVRYTGSERLEIAGDLLPETGTIRDRITAGDIGHQPLLPGVLSKPDR